MFKADRDEILNGINQLKKPSILVIGDTAIDEMVYGKNNSRRSFKRSP